MLGKRSLIWLIAAVLLMVLSQPAFAEETAKTDSEDQVQSSEIFINSNALNSMVTLKNEDEIVSGPGNKVLANLKDGSSFEVILEPAEGSEVLAFVMKLQNIETGEVSDLIPLEENYEHKIYQLPESGKYRAFGEVYFGDPAAVSLEEALSEVEANAAARMQTAMILPGDTETEDSSMQDTVSEAGPNPSTGGSDGSWITAGLILSLVTASVVLKVKNN